MEDIRGKFAEYNTLRDFLDRKVIDVLNDYREVYTHYELFQFVDFVVDLRDGEVHGISVDLEWYSCGSTETEAVFFPIQWFDIESGEERIAVIEEHRFKELRAEQQRKAITEAVEAQERFDKLLENW